MKISKQKRNQLVLVGVLTTGVLVGLYFYLVRSQQQHLENLVSRKEAAARKLQVVQQTIASSAELQASLDTAASKVGKLEEGMAAGDLYSWCINTVRNFKLNHKQIEIPQFSQVEVKETSLLPGFPYKQASMIISGTGSFHEIGAFIADFENHFPYMRVLNVSLEPAPAILQTEATRLSFKLELVALVKPS